MVLLERPHISGLRHVKSGKVREIYESNNELLLVSTDRISAFDVVMTNGIPSKGAILNQMSLYWFEKFSTVCKNHVIDSSNEALKERVGAGWEALSGRTTIAKCAETIPFECVARGYITGSLYKDYLHSGRTVHGLDLPENLIDGDKFPEPIFTPATKAETGHDENIDFSILINQLGNDTANYLRSKTLELYQKAHDHAATCGIILADAKLEFGISDEGILWIDEAFTPDSSRFWVADEWQPGRAQPSFDKQFVRDYLETIDWNKQPPGPTLPDHIIQKTQEKYLTAFEKLTGRPFHAASL